MPTPRLGGLVNRDRRELYQSTPWTNRDAGCGGCDHPTGGAGSVADFAQTIAPHPGVAGVAFQTSTHGIGKFATTLTGGSAGTEARSATQDRDFAAGPASGDTGLGLAGATRSHT